METEKQEKKYPISEIFTSPQGEGVYTGVMMTFVRLAGCTVGKPFPKERYMPNVLSDIDEHGDDILVDNALPIYTEQCTLYDGRKFACDTDYRTKERLTAKEILARVPEDISIVLITGGEPLMHDISELCQAIHNSVKRVHIETSGTKDTNCFIDWITVSPKIKPTIRMLTFCDELKILVDDNFNPLASIEISDDVSGMIAHLYERNILALAKKKPVYLQPVNFENEVNADNLRLCLDIQKKYPQFRVSPQMHKVMGSIIKEIIR